MEEVGQLIEGDGEDVLAQAKVGTCSMSVGGTRRLRALWFRLTYGGCDGEHCRRELVRASCQISWTMEDARAVSTYQA